MIETITATLVTPFMVAVAPDTAAAQAPQDNVVAYNWTTQNASAAVETEDLNTGATASFCYIPGGGGQQTVDDWHLA